MTSPPSLPRSPPTFSTLAPELKIRVLDFVLEDPPRRGLRMTSGFESSGVKVENRHMALVSRVSQEIYELVRPILWRRIRIRNGFELSSKKDSRAFFSDHILPRHGHLVQELTIDQTRRPAFIAEMISQTPNLRTLSCDVSRVQPGCLKVEDFPEALGSLEDLVELKMRATQEYWMRYLVATEWKSPIRHLELTDRFTRAGLSSRDDLTTGESGPSWTSIMWNDFLPKFSSTLSSFVLQASTIHIYFNTLPSTPLPRLTHVRFACQIDDSLSLVNAIIPTLPCLLVLALKVRSISSRPLNTQEAEPRDEEAILKACGECVQVVFITKGQTRMDYLERGESEWWDSSESDPEDADDDGYDHEGHGRDRFTRED